MTPRFNLQPYFLQKLGFELKTIWLFLNIYFNENIMSAAELKKWEFINECHEKANSFSLIMLLLTQLAILINPLILFNLLFKFQVYPVIDNLLASLRTSITTCAGYRCVQSFWWFYKLSFIQMVKALRCFYEIACRRWLL